MSAGITLRQPVADWVLPTMFSNIDNAPDASLPEGKVASIVSPPTQLPWPLTKRVGFTHIYRGDVPKDEIAINDVPTSLPIGANAMPNDTDSFNMGYGIAGSYSAKSIFTEQYNEGDGKYISFPYYWSFANQFYRGYASRLGNPSPVTNNIYGSYKGGLNNLTPVKFKITNGGYDAYPTHPFYVDGYKSQELARRILDTNNQTYNSRLPFFDYGLHEVMNLMTGAYNGLNEPDESHFEFYLLNEVLRKYLAGIQRTILFTWTNSESVTLSTDVPSKNPGWVISVGTQGDEWRIQSHHITPLSTLQFIGFFGFLLADGWMLWDSNRYNHVKDSTQLRKNTYWDSKGGFNWYSPLGNPKPSIPDMTDVDEYPFTPIVGQDVLACQIKNYEIIHPIVAAQGGAKFLRYKTNGIDAPFKTGILGDFVPSRTKLNYGQDTLLYLANDRRGLCVGGVDGTKEFVAYFNPYRSIDQKERLVVTLPNGIVRDLGDVQGSKLILYYI